MRRETFAEALSRFNEAVPFLPFTVELVNRTRIISRHPEAVTLEGDLAVYVESLGAVQLFDAASVARLVAGAIPRKAD